MTLDYITNNNNDLEEFRCQWSMWSIIKIKIFKVKRTFEINKKQIPEAKDFKCTLGGENFHEEQYDAIPETFDESLHEIHLECYKKYQHFFIIY